MKTIIIAACVITTISACATGAASHNYRASGQTDSWSIAGQMTGIDDTVSITINGAEVIKGPIGVFAGEKEFSSTYQGKQITADCRNDYPPQCYVFVNGEKAARLLF